MKRLILCKARFLRIAAITALYQMRKRGVETKLVLGDAPARRDDVLKKNIALAHRWFEQIKAGRTFTELAADEQTSKRRIQQMIPMAGYKIRCAIYTRKSSEDGLEQEFSSLDAQYEACAAYIASQKVEGWVLLPERYDAAGSPVAAWSGPGCSICLPTSTGVAWIRSSSTRSTG